VTIETEKPAPSSPAGVEADVKSALLNLGYDERAADTALAEAKRDAGHLQFRKTASCYSAALSTPARK